MPLFEDWCGSTRTEKKLKRLWKFAERALGREAIKAKICETVRSHYDSLDRIADDVALLGYDGPCCINHRTSAEYPYP